MNGEYLPSVVHIIYMYGKQVIVVNLSETEHFS